MLARSILTRYPVGSSDSCPIPTRCTEISSEKPSGTGSYALGAHDCLWPIVTVVCVRVSWWTGGRRSSSPVRTSCRYVPTDLNHHFIFLLLAGIITRIGQVPNLCHTYVGKNNLYGGYPSHLRFRARTHSGECNRVAGCKKPGTHQGQPILFGQGRLHVFCSPIHRQWAWRLCLSPDLHPFPPRL